MHDMLNAPGGLQKMTDFFVGLQVWGTPDHLSCGWPDMRPIDPRPR